MKPWKYYLSELVTRTILETIDITSDNEVTLVRRDWWRRASGVFAKMDALELQAALVKLDPATTVTPIGTTVKLVPHHRVAFTVNIDDEGDMTLEDPTRNDDEKSLAETATTVSRKTPGNCAASLTTGHHQGHHQGGGQQMGVSKCGVVEVR